MSSTGPHAMVGVMIAALLFITSVVLITPLKEVTSIGRASADCTNESLSTGEEGACIILDWFFPIFLLTVFGISVTYLGFRGLRQGEG